MKSLIIILSSLVFSIVAIANPACEIDYLNFCEHQDPRIPNMCPQVLGHHLKKTCVVTKEQAKAITGECKRELREICRTASGDDFLVQYVCLTNPEKWDKFTDVCLKSLVKDKPHH